MGARGPGHIERLAQVARPDVGIVTSVAMAHVEYFGDLDGVARAKGELVAALPASGLAVLNYDDQRVRDMASASPCPVLGYAVDADAEVRADDVTLDGELRARFTLTSPWGQGEVRLGPARSAASPRCAGRGDRRAVVRRPPRGGHRRAGRGARVPLAHGGPPRARRSGAGRRLLQRRTLPRPMRHCARWASCRGSASWQLLGLMAELGCRDRCPSTVGSRWWRRSWGSRSWATRRALYGEAQVAGVDDAVASAAHDGAGRRGPGQGEPGGAARGRRPGLRRGRGRARP